MTAGSTRTTRRIAPLALLVLALGGADLHADAPPTPRGMRGLAEVYRAQGNLVDAEMAARTAIAWTREAGGQQSSEMVDNLFVLAEVYADKGDLEASADMFDSARSLGRTIAQVGGWTVATRARQVQLLRRNAEVLRGLGETAEAAELDARAAEHERAISAAFKESLRKELGTSPGLDLQKAKRRKNIRTWINGQEVEPYTLEPMNR